MAPDPSAASTVPQRPTGLTLCSDGAVYRYGHAQLAGSRPDLVRMYNHYLAGGHLDTVCGTLDQATQHVVAKLTYPGRAEVVLAGTEGCIQGPGNVAITGIRAKNIWSALHRPRPAPLGRCQPRSSVRRAGRTDSSTSSALGGPSVAAS